MSSLRLALKMSIEDSKTPDTTEIKINKTMNKLPPPAAPPSSSLTNLTKQKRKRNENDEKTKKLTKIDDEDNAISDAETEESLKNSSDHEGAGATGATATGSGDQIQNSSNKQVVASTEKKKKKTSSSASSSLSSSSSDRLDEKIVLDNEDSVDSLISNRQPSPIPLPLPLQTIASENGNSKKSHKDRPKTPVTQKKTKNDPTPRQLKEEKEEIALTPPPPFTEFIAHLEPIKVEFIPVAESSAPPPALPAPLPPSIAPPATTDMCIVETKYECTTMPSNSDISEKKSEDAIAPIDAPPVENLKIEKIESTDAIITKTSSVQEAENKDIDPVDESEDRVDQNEKNSLSSSSSSKKSLNKRKKRGGLDMSEAEELVGGMNNNNNNNNNNSTSANNAEQPEKIEEVDETSEQNRAPSRAAAVAAKTKINNNSTKVKSTPEGESKKIEVANSEIIIPPPTILKAQWVACDKCSKWRRIPGDIDLSSLPEEWYCTMNIWDSLHNDCSHAEEEYIEKDEEEQPQLLPSPQLVEPPTKKMKSSKGTPKTPGGRRGRKPVIREAANNFQSPLPSHPTPTSSTTASLAATATTTAAAAATTSTTQGDSDDEGEGYMGTRRRRRGSYQSLDHQDGELNGQLGLILPPNATFEKVHWVQCGKCSKWRKVPGRIHEEGLPDVWYCAMNTWAIEYSRCSAKEEEDDTISIPPNLADKAFADRGGIGRGRYVRKSRTPTDSSVPNTIRPWVQCERKNCKKWRKLPAHVDINTLPEKWYCEMNSWDPERATCDASEETDSEGEQPNNSATRSQLILGNSKGPGTLSYRRLIFGTDGRIRPFYSEKNKNGYGLFSYTEVFRPNDDEYVMPTRKVSYWWSSAYQDSGVSFSTSSKLKKVDTNKSNDPITSHESYQSTLRPPQSQHLIDCILRLSQPSSSSSSTTTTTTTTANKHFFESHPPATKWSKIANEGKKITLLSRINLCCQIVRLCLLTTPEGLTLQEIYEKILTMYFIKTEMETCRNSIGLEEIKETLYRLEQLGEIEVTYNNDGLLLFRFLLQILDPYHQYVNPYPDILCSGDPFMDGRSRPLKMRKKKLKVPVIPTANSSSSTSSSSSATKEIVTDKEKSTGVNRTLAKISSPSQSLDRISSLSSPPPHPSPPPPPSSN